MFDQHSNNLAIFSQLPAQGARAIVEKAAGPFDRQATLFFGGAIVTLVLLAVVLHLLRECAAWRKRRDPAKQPRGTDQEHRA